MSIHSPHPPGAGIVSGKGQDVGAAIDLQQLAEMRLAERHIVGRIVDQLVGVVAAHAIAAGHQLRRPRHQLHQAARPGMAFHQRLELAFLPRQPVHHRPFDRRPDRAPLRHGVDGKAVIVDIDAAPRARRLGEAHGEMGLRFLGQQGSGGGKLRPVLQPQSPAARGRAELVLPPALAISSMPPIIGSACTASTSASLKRKREIGPTP